MAYMDEPSGNGAVIPSYLLAKEAKKYVKVLLSGEGGDEISNAYDTHLAHKIQKMYLKHIPGAVRKLIYNTAHKMPVSMKKLSFDFLAKRFTEGVEKDAPRAHMHWRHVFTEDEKKLLLREPYTDFRSTDDIFANLFYKMNFEDSLDRISLLDLKYFFICDLMVKNDRTFMANSVEARFPFVDRKVVDFVTTIPSRHRIKGFTTRYFEKESMRRILPEKIYRRKSMGLEMPHSLWFFEGLDKAMEKYFTKKNIEKAEIFNYGYIRQLWEEHRQKKRDNGRALWSILNYLIWFDLFVYNRDYKNYLT
jgi:asparagine synthase (glutamine-hydrolysing)